LTKSDEAKYLESHSPSETPLMKLPFRHALAAATILAAAPLAATTVVIPTDRNLVRAADLIVVATVESRLPPAKQERPVTDYWVRVERVLKGDLDGSVLILRNPGGTGEDGMSLKLWGVPEFTDGESALLFLRPRADGTYRILHTVLGAFHTTAIGGRRVAYRDLSDVDVLSSEDENDRGFLPWRRQRDVDRFADWIADAAAGRAPVADYFFATPEASGNTLLPMFELLNEAGRNMRWFEFDSNRSVPWRIDPDSLGGFSGDPASSFQTAINAWNNEARTPIRYTFNGTSGLTAGFNHYDGQNVLLYEDPNDDVDDSFSCSTGGTLAIGGPWYNTSNTGRFKGETFNRIQGGDIVLNDGLSCFFQRSSPVVASELFAHELGHTLGLGHSSESAGETNQSLRDALMYFRLHNDGRGPSLRNDDLAGIRRLYESSTTGGGGGGGNCPAGALCLLNGRFQVTGSFNNQFDGSSGAAGPIRNTDLSGFFYFTDPSNVELIVKTLDFGDHILFFYSQLTNLRFTLRVLDTQTGREKTYQNTAGECGAIDNNLTAASAPADFALERGLELAPAAACQSNANSACLLGGRFRVELAWRNQFDGTSGAGLARRLSDLTAAFAFTDPSNLEILIKTLDFSDHVLVLYGALSNLEYTLTVTEVATGRVKTYHNAAGNYCGGLDSNAF
jgi:hypothetical protein